MPRVRTILLLLATATGCYGAPFSPWTMVATDVASSPDCAVVGSDSIVHVVTLSSRGTVLDVNGKGTTWVATDLGLPSDR
jgi:hypothetical protein